MKPARAPHQPIKLLRIDIPAPCSASWDEMTGDHRVRHCEGCNKNVVNLSAMPAAEGAALVAANLSGDLCVRIHKRPDGSVVSSDGGGHARATASQPWRALPGMAGAALLALSAAGCSTGEAAPAAAVTAGPTVSQEAAVTVLMGAPPATAPVPADLAPASVPALADLAPARSPVKGGRQCEPGAQLQQLIGKPQAGHSMPYVLIDRKGICTR